MGGQKSIYSPLGASNHSDYERVEQDYYATHPSAVNHLLERERFGNNIWECACGEGHLSRRLEKLGKQVYSTDLVNRGYGDDFFNFLTTSKKWNGDIITNPPYKLADKFVRQAMKIIDREKKVAMFLKLTFLESVGRISLFERYPPKKVWVYSFRQAVARNGEEEMFKKSSAVCYAWFIWIKGYKGESRIGWITKKEDK